MSLEKGLNNFGFGVMRLKMNGDEVDYDEFNKMIDVFIDGGFNYFDTAHGYIDGKSETAIKKCLVSRYKREDYILADKLSPWFFEKEEDILPMFESQLEACGVEYFDYYLIHTVHRSNYDKYKNARAFEQIKELKNQGKIKHIAMSFHDSAEFLDMVLTEQKDVEAVQLMFNYLDYDDPNVQSKACYDVAVKHGKKVIVMEPVRGGVLANLSEKSLEVLKSVDGGSPATFALRFAQSFPEVSMVLSGMSNVDMVIENVEIMNDFAPFSEEEYKAAEEIRNIIRMEKQVPCTKCNYCKDVCTENIPISNLFEEYNKFLSAKLSKKQVKENISDYWQTVFSCVKCKKCEEVCPQKIKISEELEKLTKDLGIKENSTVS